VRGIGLLVGGGWGDIINVEGIGLLWGGYDSVEDMITVGEYYY